jgi:hypothetical protein
MRTIRAAEGRITMLKRLPRFRYVFRLAPMLLTLSIDLLTEWRRYDNAGRPHMSLGPGMPQPPMSLPAPWPAHRYRLLAPLRMVVRPSLGGLHHEYSIGDKAA